MDPTLEKPIDGLRPKAPGMKYTHYAPKGEMTLVEAMEDSETRQDLRVNKKVITTIQKLARDKQKEGFKVGIMASKETLSYYDGYGDTLICVGERKGQQTVAAGLYGALREFDAAGADFIYAESFRGEELSDAIMNRLLKAAGHRVFKV
jgi:L-threonylcarbamoyladenylate synthase